MNCPQCGAATTGPGECAACAELRERRRELAPSFDALARRVDTIAVPDQLEAALLAEFDLVHRRPVGSQHRWFVTAAALAASFLAGVLVLRQPAHTPNTTAATAQSEPASFLPIPFTQPIQPYERVMVVQTSVPVTALIAAGFQVRSVDPGGSVQADVMVSQDGRPRAIRPISFQSSDRRLP